MADFTNMTTASLYFYTSIERVGGRGDIRHVYSPITVFSVPGPKKYVQRIFDNTLNRFCYYDNRLVLPSPSASQTTPNRVGTIKAGSHEIMDSYYQTDNIDINFNSTTNLISFVHPVSASLPAARYLQRIYDNTLSASCYYFSDKIIANPISSLTRPNHTNNIKSGSHEIMQVII